MDLAQLNALPRDEAHATFLRCCGARRWADALVAARPFRDAAALFLAAEGAERSLSPDDWKEAFAAHPKIGDVESLRKKFATTAQWAHGEQSGVRGASEEVLTGLAEGNGAYERRFGYIFIVCATGKSADEMLAILGGRLGHAPEKELGIAAAEQAKITRIRLEKLLT
ncbi:MAG: 2-oxo-4-hydroxy-4-carboxy-5-ureidoimidazoline decarboxylase [Planctomycetes bacterium]|nr:2-oxo-4-hydroxy-4-carboxy-5-ureidoimidazoline decarboxylase [Planctomycetota bacterium]